MMAIESYELTGNHFGVYFRWVNCMVFELFLNEII
jgi:hypothetical protein